MSISSYSTTASANTLVGGINIGESCPPSGVNDALRQIMADVAEGNWGTGSITAGKVTLSGSVSTDTVLRSYPTVSYAGNAFGCSFTPTYQSNVTSAYNYYSLPTTQAAAFTLGVLCHYYAAQPSFGAGSSVTNQYGFYAESTIANATNNYGFYSNLSSGSNKWNFYCNGTAQNYFGGYCLFGTTTLPTSADATGSGIAIQTDSTFVVNSTASGSPRYVNKTSYVSGTTYFDSFNVNGVNKGSISYAGATVAYNTTSDRRLKDGIQALAKSALETIKKIPIYSLFYKDDADKKRVMGFIADEVQQHMPECVTGSKDDVDENGNPVYQMVDYSKFSPALIACVQELAQQNEQLAARLAVLEGKNG